MRERGNGERVRTRREKGGKGPYDWRESVGIEGCMCASICVRACVREREGGRSHASGGLSLAVQTFLRNDTRFFLDKEDPMSK